MSVPSWWQQILLINDFPPLNYSYLKSGKTRRVCFEVKNYQVFLFNMFAKQKSVKKKVTRHEQVGL